MAQLKRAAGLTPSSPTVLLVDDDDRYLDSLARFLEGDSARLLRARSGLHALEQLKTETVSLVVSDYWMPGMDGVQLLDEVMRLYPRVGRVLLTGRPDADIVLDSTRHRLLVKGMEPDLIRRVILREARRHG